MVSKRTSLILSIIVISLYFLVEIIVGYLSSSIALIADSFHMLTDVFALIIALYASHLVAKTTRKNNNTYGYQRAEILGALINGVFLIALCLTIFINSIQRLVQVENVENPLLVLIVGGVGLLINLAGLFLFHGHSHGHHGHSHAIVTSVVPVVEIQQVVVEANGNGHGSHNHDSHNHNSHNHDDSHNHHSHNETSHTSHNHGSLNMKGVFLHFLGDALGSVAVVVSALLNLLLPPSTISNQWVVYVDPIASLLISILLICTAVPLVRSTLNILLQHAPPNFDINKIKSDLQEIQNVVNIHEFHVWQLSEGKTVASVHVLISPPPLQSSGLSEFSSHQHKIVSEIQLKLHGYGVHNTTVQPEFVERVGDDDATETTPCLQRCPSDACKTTACC